MLTTAGAVAFDAPADVAEGADELDGTRGRGCSSTSWRSSTRTSRNSSAGGERQRHAGGDGDKMHGFGTRGLLAFSGGASMEDGPAVDADGLAGHVGGARRAQPGDQRADVGGGAETPGRDGREV